MSLRMPSKGEAAFTLHCKAEKLTPEREYKFHPERRWRFDFCFPAQMIAVEIEGGIWSGGAHTRGAHFESDAEKYNSATKLGWRVMRYSTNQVERGDAINDLLEMLR